MPSTNSSEWEARWEQNEREHEKFRRDLRDLLAAQVIQKAQIDDLLAAQDKFSQQFEREVEERKAKDAVLDARENFHKYQS
jgi:septal ring factor EnvC (AmiA/AmiB activator)